MPFLLWLWFRNTSILTLVLVISFASLFFITTTFRIQLPTELPSQSMMTWTSQVKINGGTIRGFMENEQQQKIYVTYKIKDEKEKQQLMANTLAGKSFIVTGQLVEPTPKQHPYSFDMKRYFKSHRATGVFEIETWQYIPKKHSLLSLIYEQRFKMTKQIEKTFPQSISAEAKALILGNQEDVQQEDQRAYQVLGITHLFAISGLHVGLLTIIFLQLLKRAHVRKEHAKILLCISLPLYALLVGGAPSVWRAVITVLVILMLSSFTRKPPLLTSLSLCFIIFVMIEPNSIFQIGFQLSFLAAFAIILSTKIINYAKNKIVASFYITVVCQLLVTPILLYNFYEISLSSFMLNILFVPLFSIIILPANLILLCISYLPFNSLQFIFQLYEPFRHFIQVVIMKIQAIPYQMWNPGKPTVNTLLILFSNITAFFLALETQKKRLLIFLLMISFCFLINFEMNRHLSLRMTFISVGQGDATLIELPNKSGTILVDAGGILRFGGEEWKQPNNEYEVGRQVIVPFLKGRGISKIDQLILTHADADHVEGAEEVLEAMNIDEIHITPNSLEKNVMNDVVTEAQKQRIPIIERMAGMSWKVGEVEFEYLMPTDTEYEGNNDSLVLLVRYKEHRILLPGDLEMEGEAELLRKNAEKISNVTVLKAGHHGSKTSTTEDFLKVTNPEIIIYSTGLNNRYNHPSKEVTDRVENAGIPSLNTANEQTIILQFDDEVKRILE